MKSNMENTGKKWEGATGEWVEIGSHVAINHEPGIVAWTDSAVFNKLQQRAHRLLIIDAGNTIQKCGLMPSELIDKVEKLQAFKDYVHDRLDKMGIEKDPESEHKEAGCRIGGRLDILQQQRDELINVLSEIIELSESDMGLERAKQLLTKIKEHE